LPAAPSTGCLCKLGAFSELLRTATASLYHSQHPRAQSCCLDIVCPAAPWALSWYRREAAYFYAHVRAHTHTLSCTTVQRQPRLALCRHKSKLLLRLSQAQTEQLGTQSGCTHTHTHTQSRRTWAMRGLYIGRYMAHGHKAVCTQRTNMHRHVTKCLSCCSHPVTVSTASFLLYDIASPPTTSQFLSSTHSTL